MQRAALLCRLLGWSRAEALACTVEEADEWLEHAYAIEKALHTAHT